MQSADFIVNLFGNSTGRVFLSTLPNPELKGTPAGEPDERHVWTRNREQIGAFVAKWNRPGRATYLAVSTFQRGATIRCKDTVQELIALHADIDFHATVESPEAILQIVEQLRPPPSLVIHSGHGLHLYWVFKESIAATAES
jgi:putative DNA primase/helicase